jgi:hypothetical protein
MAEMPDKEFKNLLLKITNELKEHSNEQVNEGRKSIHRLD